MAYMMFGGEVDGWWTVDGGSIVDGQSWETRSERDLKICCSRDKKLALAS